MGESGTAILELVQKKVETEMKSAFAEIHGDVKSRLEKSEAEQKKWGETTEKTGNELKSLGDKFDQLMADFQGHVAEMKARVDEIDSEKERKRVLGDPGNLDWSRGGTPIGHALTSHPYFEKYVKEMQCHGQAAPIPVPAPSACRPSALNRAFFEQEEVKELLAKEGIEIKALSGTSDALRHFSTLLVPDIKRDPMEPNRIRDAIPTLPTTKETIQYLEETVFTNAAATVAAGDPKPESAITFVLRRVPVEVLATWIPIHNQLLDDIPSLRAYVEQRLRDGIMDEEDAQLLYGSGSSPDLQGFFTHGSVQTYDPAIDGVAGDTEIDMIRRSITKVRVSKYVADGVILSPQDFEKIELAKGNDDHYLWTLPSSPKPTTIWRLPIYETTAVVEGDFLVGAFRRACALYDRMQAAVRMADQHASLFIANTTVILLEERICLVIFRPQAIVAGSFLAGS